VGFWKKTVKEYDLHGKQVVVRADYNVPIDESGTITDDYRITQSLPTLQYLLEQACSIVIISHMGRPKDEHDKKYSLEPVAKRLAEKFNREVKFAHDCVGKDAKQKVNDLQPGDILLLENLRFHKEEEANNNSFAKQLAEHGEVFVQDGFGVVHRAHASTDAITKHLPSVAGLLLEREAGTIADGMDDPARPLMTIIGGAKVSDKIDVLRRFVEHADVVAIGGAMANVFLQARGMPTGNSKLSEDDLPLAREILETAAKRSSESDFIFYLPQDAVVATEITPRAQTRIVDWGSHVFADIESYPSKPDTSAIEVGPDDMILDIGPYSGAFIAGAMQLCKTVIWNGAMGVTEVKSLQGPIGPFSHGTDTIVRACGGEFGNRPHSIVGGGDTVGYLQSTNTLDHFSHVSTGGGASLELMSGNQLPGIESLWDKE
jgi:phosphoglycerate kinase